MSARPSEPAVFHSANGAAGRARMSAVLFRMLPCGIVLMLGRFQVMTERNPGMVRCLLVIGRLVVLRGLAMMFGSLIIVLRGLLVMP